MMLNPILKESSSFAIPNMMQMFNHNFTQAVEIFLVELTISGLLHATIFCIDLFEILFCNIEK